MEICTSKPVNESKSVVNKFAKWNGKNSHELFNMLEKIGDRLTLVYGEPRSKAGLSRACSAEVRRSGRRIELVSWTSHIAVVEFKGLV